MESLSPSPWYGSSNLNPDTVHQHCCLIKSTLKNFVVSGGLSLVVSGTQAMVVGAAAFSGLSSALIQLLEKKKKTTTKNKKQKQNKYSCLFCRGCFLPLFSHFILPYILPHLITSYCFLLFRTSCCLPLFRTSCSFTPRKLLHNASSLVIGKT